MFQNLFSSLLSLDQSLFLSINHLLHTPLTNTLGLLLSGVGTAGIIWFFLGLYLFFREEKKDLPASGPARIATQSVAGGFAVRRWQAGRWFFFSILFAGGLSWLIVEAILKPLVARSRPGLELGAILVGSTTNDSYSFPSGHATIAFAMAVVLSHKEPKWRRVFYVLAVLISLSRIFLGKHYPIDVIVGGLLGWSIGKLSLFFLKFIKHYSSYNS